MNQSKNNSTYPVVCFGEILWDLLPSGAVPGGAPMNVAYHLKKLGINPGLITRVGTDNWGINLINLMKRNKIETDYIQLDGVLETGKVNATICANNEMSYDILMPVAWDNIQMNKKVETLVSNSQFFVFGSLVTRNDISRNTLYQLIEMADYKVVDINLRPPHYNRAIVEKLMGNADLLKLNIAELELITDWYSAYSTESDRISVLQNIYHIENIVVTKGGDGALLNVGGMLYEHPGFKVEVKDTIGSGDSFLAGLLSRLMSGDKPPEALEFACGLGALIASYTGACPDYKIEEINNLIHKNSTIS